MKTKKQNPDFLHIGTKLLKWYDINARDLPFRKTKNPYNIWICEIVFQQTRIEQGLQHYEKFIERFPNVHTLAIASTDEVLLYWKGLGYYSRALNIHKASQQIMCDYNGVFPEDYDEIIKLKGVGKYTAAAISSICFGNNLPAIDGNFYRILSRIFADDFDVFSTKAYAYFSELAFKILPENTAGNFNQAMMDLGSEICKPKNPKCEICPLNADCIAFSTGKINQFPVKIKKTKVTELELKYYFVKFGNNFIIQQRKDDFIWKKLYEFPVDLPSKFSQFIVNTKIMKHKLTHKNLVITIDCVTLNSEKELVNFANQNNFQIINYEQSHQKSFPKPLENYLHLTFD